MRKKIRRIKEDSSLLNESVQVKGWVRTVRNQKKFAFIELNDGSTLSNLQEIADAHHIPYPSGDDIMALIERDLVEASRLNIQGVPYFIVAGEWAISGAHPPETFQPLFDAAIAKANATTS